MVKPRENRVPIMLSDEELAAIDDWRFTYRVATRSEAIRRLCQIGLRSVRAFPKIARDITDVLDMASDAIDIPEDVISKMEVDSVDKTTIDREIAGRLYDAVNFTFNRQIEAQDHFHHLLVEISPFTNNSELESAIQLANRYHLEDTPNEEVLLSIGESRRLQLERWRERRDRIRADAKGKEK